MFLSSLWRKNLVLGLAFLTAVLALKSGPASGAETELPNDRGLLWQIEKPGTAPSYLFGTIHITDPQVLDLPAPVRDALDRSQAAVFELLLDDTSRIDQARLAVLTDGRSLEDMLDPALYQETMEAAASYGLPEPAVRQFKPWFLTSLLMVSREEFLRKAQGHLPLDQVLMADAREQGKELGALETLEEQLSLFENIAEEEQIAMLRNVVEDLPKARGQFDQLVQAYLARDLRAMYDLMVAQTAQHEAGFAQTFQKDFVDERNHRMAERLAPWLEKGGAFVAVGALHLPGEDGLVELLQQQGYQVTPVY